MGGGGKNRKTFRKERRQDKEGIMYGVIQISSFLSNSFFFF